MIEYIYDLKNELLSIIVSHKFSKPGIHFFTDNSLSQQLALMQHPKGKIIDPHIHNPVAREVHYTQEVLLIRKGRLRVDFYDESRQYLQSRVLETGDIILLIKGGHGFEALEELEMFEVKQGPYTGDQDKTKFIGISPEQIKIHGD